MYNTEVKTITKSLPLLRWNTCKSLIFSYSAYFSRIFRKNYNWFPILQDETPLNTERLAASRLRVALISTTWYVSIFISSMAKTRSWKPSKKSHSNNHPSFSKTSLFIPKYVFKYIVKNWSLACMEVKEVITSLGR